MEGEEEEEEEEVEEEVMGDRRERKRKIMLGGTLSHSFDRCAAKATVKERSRGDMNPKGCPLNIDEEEIRSFPDDDRSMEASWTPA
ncbi:unnamed protein product [Gadus morhua 'NCC']